MFIWVSLSGSHLTARLIFYLLVLRSGKKRRKPDLLSHLLVSVTLLIMMIIYWLPSISREDTRLDPFRVVLSFHNWISCCRIQCRPAELIDSKLKSHLFESMLHAMMIFLSLHSMKKSHSRNMCDQTPFTVVLMSLVRNLYPSEKKINLVQSTGNPELDLSSSSRVNRRWWRRRSTDEQLLESRAFSSWRKIRRNSVKKEWSRVRKREKKSHFVPSVQSLKIHLIFVLLEKSVWKPYWSLNLFSQEATKFEKQSFSTWNVRIP